MLLLSCLVELLKRSPESIRVQSAQLTSVATSASASSIKYFACLVKTSVSDLLIGKELVSPWGVLEVPQVNFRQSLLLKISFAILAGGVVFQLCSTPA